MAHKSIADQILIDLKNERKGVIEHNKNVCLEYMKATFDHYAFQKFVKCEADKTYLFFNNALPIDEGTFILVSETLGFKITADATAFLVPKHEKGQKMTPAQSMLYNHQIAFNKKLKECNKAAQEEINRVWGLIKDREFSYIDNDDGTFTILITLKRTRSKMFCDEKLLKFLSDRAFPNATINDNTLSIILGKKE